MTATAETGQDTPAEESSLWVKSFQGEVLGEAYFSRLAQLAADVEQRAKLEALAALERCTKEMLVPHLQRLGLSTEADQAIVEGVAAVDHYDWATMLSGLLPVVADYLACYSRLRQIVAEEDARAAELLIAHEMALELFARRELAGDHASSLEPIRALPHFSLS
ncbi:MAG TPA: hypothetical protein VFA11_01120 [Acidimicrobiales bacterium]|nr:hypothetical protein [Acidimicrobiales bacterium]